VKGGKNVQQQLSSILTPKELRMNIRFVRQMMLNKELVLGYLEPSLETVQPIEAIRVRLSNLRVEVKSDLDRDWRPVDLTEIVVW
jgi:hypothetical protein